MNRTKIEWADFTWNPIVGCTKLCHDGNGKIWCYAYYQAKRNKNRCIACGTFRPHLHSERLAEPYHLRKPSKIFICSMGEFFDNQVKDEWRDEVRYSIVDNWQHTFQILTKQPQNIYPKGWPHNTWIGISLTGKKDTISLNDIDNFLNLNIIIKFINLEPYLKKIDRYNLTGFNWVIIGGKTGYNPFTPPKEWISEIVSYCREHNIPIFLKNNCHYPEKIQEYPQVDGV